MSPPEHKEKIWNYIKDIKVGMLTTLNEGELRARPMYVVQKDYDGFLWFFTRKSSEKADEVHETRDVCISFASPADDVYVSLTGTARVTQDGPLIKKFWNPFVAAWFEGDENDDDVALLEIKVKKGEHWDATDNKITQLYEIAKANMSDETPDLGENQKFGTSK